MTDIVVTKLGPVDLALSFTGGKLIGKASDAAVGAEDDLSIDGKVILTALQGVLDAKFPAEAKLIDMVMGVVSSAVLAL